MAMGIVIKNLTEGLAFIRGKLDGHMREVLSGAAVAFALKVVAMALAFAFNVLLSRMLGADGAGIFFLALTITTIATIFGRVGLDKTLLRFVAAGAYRGDWSAVMGAGSKGNLLALAASTAMAAALFIFSPWLAGTIFKKPELAGALRWMSLAVVPFALMNLHAEMLKGLKRIRDSVVVQNVAISLVSLVLLYPLARLWGINGAVVAYSAAAVVAMLYGMALWKGATPVESCRRGEVDYGMMLKSSVPLMWVALMGLLMYRSGTIALGVWSTKADVGIFSMAMRTAMLTSFVLTAVNSIVAPKFAALYAEGDMKSLGSLARHSAVLMTAAAAPMLFVFILIPGRVMGIFGEGFASGGAVLAVLSLAQFINVATGSVGVLLMMSGHERLLRNNMLAVSALNIALNVALVPRYGLMGAAIAAAVSLSSQNIVASYLVFRRLKVRTLPWPSFV